MYLFWPCCTFTINIRTGKAEYAAWLSNEAAKKMAKKPTTSAKKDKKKGPVLLLRSSPTRQTKSIQ
jgi:hypothetical protein